MKTKSQLFLCVALLLCVTLGCKFAGQVKEELDKSKSPKEITATDNSTRFTVPGGWQVRTDLHEDARLQAANLFAEQYAIVITESKEDFARKVTLRDYAAILMETSKESVPDMTFSAISDKTINGYPAVQYEGIGTVENNKIKWIFTLIETPKNFHQLAVWTLPSRFESNKETLFEVINSFKELDNGAAPVSNINAPSK